MTKPAIREISCGTITCFKCSFCCIRKKSAKLFITCRIIMTSFNACLIFANTVSWVISKEFKVQLIQLIEFPLLADVKLGHIMPDPIFLRWLWPFSLVIFLDQFRQQGGEILLHCYVHCVLHGIFKVTNDIILNIAIMTVVDVGPAKAVWNFHALLIDFS